MCKLTAFDLQRTDLPVHGKIREIHGTASGHRQAVQQARTRTNTNSMTVYEFIYGTAAIVILNNRQMY